MKSQMSFDELGHQSVQRSAAGGYELQNVFAFALLFEGSCDGVYLSPNPTDSRQEFLLSLVVWAKAVLRVHTII